MDIPIFLLSGNQIAFASNRSGSYEIWISNKTGDKHQKISDFKQGFCGTPRWSPDGKMLVFDWRTEGQSDIYLIDLSNKQLRQVTKDEGDDIAPFFTDNSEVIFFSSNRNGHWQIWKQNLKKEQAIPFSEASVVALQKVKKTQSYFHSYFDQTGIWQVFPEYDSIELIVPNVEPVDWCNWVSSERGIYFVQRIEGRNNDFIAYYDFATKKNCKDLSTGFSYSQKRCISCSFTRWENDIIWPGGKLGLRF